MGSQSATYKERRRPRPRGRSSVLEVVGGGGVGGGFCGVSMHTGKVSTEELTLTSRVDVEVDAVVVVAVVAARNV